MNRVLFITHEAIAPQMAGPAIRAWELAKQLSQITEVTVTSPFPCEISHPQVKAFSYQGKKEFLKRLCQEHDILVIQGPLLQRYPFIAKMGKYLVADLYDPYLFESYPFYLEQPDSHLFLRHWQGQNQQMRLADYSICASERQRDLWIGRYCALGRLTPAMYEQDSSFASLIGVVPFGHPGKIPGRGQPVLKGVIPGIEPDDFVLLWGGGIWNWFDPLTVIRAIANINDPHIKLFFMGARHPNPGQPAMRMYNEAIALASELGVKDRQVFFNSGWVPYHERHGYLLEADAGVSAHFDAIETRFSFRTRVLDYLWCGLPILTTAGDSMAELVERTGIGRVIAPEDVAGWTNAILEMAAHRELHQAMRKKVLEVSPRFAWQQAAQPLVQYCEAPYHTPRAMQPVKEFARHFYRQGGMHIAKKVFSRIWRSV